MLSIFQEARGWGGGGVIFSRHVHICSVYFFVGLKFEFQYFWGISEKETFFIGYGDYLWRFFFGGGGGGSLLNLMIFMGYHYKLTASVCVL